MTRSWKIYATATAATMALILAGCGQQTLKNEANQSRAAVALVAATTGQVRTYYIAADEVLWDYAPDDTNDITGAPFTADEQVFTKQGPNRIGHKYWKSLYRGYTDASFTQPIVRPTSCAPTARVCDDTLGMLGPVIRAAVGDTIKVVFKNNTPYPASVHPHGVFYQKNAEGAPYADGTAGGNKADDAVLPGTTFTYNWGVPDRAGPGPMDGPSVLWMYHSHTDEVADTNAGLIGPWSSRPRHRPTLPPRHRWTSIVRSSSSSPSRTRTRARTSRRTSRSSPVHRTTSRQATRTRSRRAT